MRIALTIHALHGGGAERQLAELADFLVAHGHEVTVITWDHTHTDQYRVDSRVQRIGLGLMSDSRNLWQALLANRRRVQALSQQLRKYRPDVVISFTDKMNIVTLACRPTSPVIIAERSDPRKQKLSRLWETWRNRTYPRAAAMIALTQPIAAALKARFPNSQVVVIPNAVAIASSSTTTEKPHTAEMSNPSTSNHLPKRRALAVGRLSPEKGFDLLLKAWQQANPAAEAWELVIVGDGPSREQLEKLRSELGLQHEVHFAGWCQDVATQYRTADLYISSSHYEAMSRSLLEALSYQLPVIATRATDGLEEIVQANVNGWLVPTADVVALAAAIRAATTPATKLNAMGAKSASLVKSHAWSNIGPKWLDLIEKVVCNQKAS
jgi:glycosyltransferase involved in cell wall biosynthesis